jgi:hypothetical protein
MIVGPTLPQARAAFSTAPSGATPRTAARLASEQARALWGPTFSKFDRFRPLQQNPIFNFHYSKGGVPKIEN